MAMTLDDIYKDKLGRAPDAAGKAYWQKEIDSGKLTLDQVANSIHGSTEAQNRRYTQGYGRAEKQATGGFKPGLLQGNDSTTEIRNLYRNNLGRFADDAGLKYWEGVAADKGMDHVRDAFGNTQEVQGYNAFKPQTPANQMPIGERWGNTGAVRRGVDFGNETMEGRLERLLDPNNPLMKQAATRGKEYAAGRGLLNSSIAAEAVQGEMMKSAMPIAQNDANTYFKQGLTNQQYDNQFNLNDRQFLQGLEQDAFRNDLTMGRDLNQANLNLRNTTAVETLKQNSGLYAQFLQSMSEINSADMDAGAKQNAINQLWTAIEKGSSLASSLGSIRFDNSGNIVYSNNNALSGLAPSVTAPQSGSQQAYVAGQTTNADGELVDRNGNTAPSSAHKLTTDGVWFMPSGGEQVQQMGEGDGGAGAF